MADTASNANRTIATKGSNHIALMTAPDVCKLPSGVPVPFPNFVPTTRAGAGKTNNTFIGNKEIVLDRTKVGPPSDPGHAGVLGGVKSGTYRFEAQATSFSKDVFAEGGALVRSFDTTTQNQGNTVGMVLSLVDVQSLKAQEEEKKKKCVIDLFHGECVHGRPLGWPGTKQDGEPWYIEVLEQDTVHFRTVRKDVTKDPHEPYPKCIAGNHTAWYAEAIKFPNPAATKARKPESGTTQAEVFSVDASLAIEDWVMFLLGYDKKGTEVPDYKLTEDESEKPTREKAVQSALDDLKRSNPKANRRDREEAKTAANRKFNEYQQKTGEKGKANPKWEDSLTKKSMVVSVREALLFWLWYAAAPEISVNALACGGSRHAKIRVFPSRDFKFYLEFASKKRNKAIPTKDAQAKQAAEREAASAQLLQSLKRLDKAELHFQIIYNTFNALRVLLGLAEKMADAAGPVMGSKLHIQFLVGLRVEWKFQYVECDQLKGRFEKDKRTPAHVGHKWSIFLGAKPLIGVNGYITFPLLNLGPPGVGWLASKIIKLEVFFAGKTTITVGGTVGRDEYDFCTYGGAAMEGTLRFEAGLAIGIGRWKAIEVKIVFDCSFEGKLCLFINPDCLIGAQVGGSIEGSFSVIVCPDSWIWRKELVDWRPHWARKKFGPKDMTVLPNFS